MMRGSWSRELGLLEEVPDFLRVIMVTLATDTLDLSNLACTYHSLDVLEVDLWVLTEVDNRPKIVVETYGEHKGAKRPITQQTTYLQSS